MSSILSPRPSTILPRPNNSGTPHPRTRHKSCLLPHVIDSRVVCVNISKSSPCHHLPQKLRNGLLDKNQPNVPGSYGRGYIAPPQCDCPRYGQYYPESQRQSTGRQARWQRSGRKTKYRMKSGDLRENTMRNRTIKHCGLGILAQVGFVPVQKCSCPNDPFVILLGRWDPKR